MRIDAGEDAAAVGHIKSEIVAMLNLQFNTCNSKEQIIQKPETVDCSTHLSVGQADMGVAGK